MDHTTHFLKPRLVTEMIWIPEMQPPSLLHPLLLCSFTHNGNLCISFVVSVQYKDKFSILPDALFPVLSDMATSPYVAPVLSAGILIIPLLYRMNILCNCQWSNPSFSSVALLFLLSKLSNVISNIPQPSSVSFCLFVCLFYCSLFHSLKTRL